MEKEKLYQYFVEAKKLLDERKFPYGYEPMNYKTDCKCDQCVNFPQRLRLLAYAQDILNRMYA